MPRPSKYKSKLRVGRGSHGLGLFAETDIARGDFIIEYTGEKITSEEADKRGGRYLFDVDKGLVLDAKNHKHKARYINHSCKPNCYAEVDTDDMAVYIYAKRNIKAGEELNYHYGKEYWEDIIGGKRHCACGGCKND